MLTVFRKRGRGLGEPHWMKGNRETEQQKIFLDREKKGKKETTERTIWNVRPKETREKHQLETFKTY